MHREVFYHTHMGKARESQNMQETPKITNTTKGKSCFSITMGNMAIDFSKVKC